MDFFSSEEIVASLGDKAKMKGNYRLFDSVF